jgi:hypothetical protein
LPEQLTSVGPDLVALARSVEELERRVAALEQTLAVSGAGVPESVQPHAAPIGELASLAEHSTVTTLALIGRTLMALGGAYLLRALTEGGVLPVSAGVSAGLVYAIGWLALATRAAARAERSSASFHGLTSAMVAFPLIWEATVRFGLLGPSASALLLGAFAGVTLSVAVRSHLESIAWFGALGATGTAVGLAIATRGFEPYTIFLVLLGIATVWLGYVRGWVLVRWPVAAAVDLMTLATVMRAVDPDVPRAAGPAIALLLFPVAGYLGTFVSRTLFLGRDLIPFEVVQSAAVMLAGFGGALAVLRAAGISAIPLGVGVLVLGAACYAFAFTVVEPRQHWRNLAFYTSLAVSFTLAGVSLLLPPDAALLAFMALAVLSVESGRRSGRLMLAFHAVFYAVGAVVVSGLGVLASQALAGSVERPWRTVGAAALLGLATVTATVAWPSSAVPARWKTLATALRLANILLLLWTGSGLAVAVLVPLLAGAAGPGTDAGLIATIRTCVLIGALALVVSVSPRRDPAVRTWLTYALLAAIGVKIAAEDLPKGRPATLFLALALYGAALVIAPRLTRRGLPPER